MSALIFTSFFLSLSLYLAQISIYTENQELLVYGAFGALWFLTLYLNAFGTKVRSTATGILLLSGVAAFGLGFVPHRLRLGPEFNVYLVLFPTIHFLATLAFLSVTRHVEQQRGNREINPAS